MRTRIHEWVQVHSRIVYYGVQVYQDGKWQHAHRSGDPLMYRTEERAEIERAKLRKVKP